ncbi:MAG TPA: efflux RND transporter periplasmic adaptor subunit [Leptolyngbyaceae cyanobacterium M33_DOE_097]|uniref:Efflux RND transporter periplasmic adaptor subunit n=1 Tax=Oscillatoriales cyanobacterium SpSt-418 TaxID=2282169 RepID=A0A7C3PLV9_9CYAN|nr:efflux RND transporter periplasmic adaptor subunit [Leptolyngbyaceae cyanobacterium M33_DOE_097]
MTSPQISVISEEHPEVSSQRPSPRKPIVWTLILTLLLGGGGYLFWRVFAPNSVAPPAIAQPTAMPVKALSLKSHPIAERAEYVGQLKSRRSVTLRPRIQGQVTQIWAEPGQRVTKGTILLQVDPNEQLAILNGGNAAIASAEASIDSARATLRSLQAARLSKVADVKFAQQDYERFAYLAQEGAVATQLRDQYTNKLEVAKAALGAIDEEIRAQQAAIVRSEKGLQEAQARTQQQQVQLQYFQISAPFAGVVGDIPIKVGDFVDPATALITVSENDQLEVNFSVPTEQATQLQVGDAIALLDRQGKPTATSKISFIAPNTANTTQSVLVKAQLDNRNGKLRTDQFARVRVTWNRRSGVLVPTSAVTRLGGEAFVFVAEPTQSGFVARQRLVKLNRVEGNQYQVLSGLKPGERVITSGVMILRDDAPVQPEL